MNFNVGDFFQGNEITRISDSFVFFGKQRKSIKKIKELIKFGAKIEFKTSPNTIIDWTIKKDVLEYYSSFNEWSFYISNGDMSDVFETLVIEVKDNLVFYKDEYFLPSPSSRFNDICNKMNEIKNGLYNVKLLKRLNSFYPTSATKETIVINTFILGKEVLEIKDFTLLKPNSNEIYIYPYGGNGSFDYYQDVISGVSINKINLNVFRFFNNFYLFDKYSKQHKFNLNKDEIYNLISGVQNKIDKILNDCIVNISYDLDYTESYGDFSINYIELHKNVVNDIFEVFEKRFSEYNNIKV
jgi:hypothetical protein